MSLDEDFRIQSIDYLWQRINDEMKDELEHIDLNNIRILMSCAQQQDQIFLLRLVLIALDSIIIGRRKDDDKKVDGEIKNVFIPPYCIFQQNYQGYRIHAFAKKSFDDVDKLKANMLNDQYLSNFAQNLYQSFNFNVPYSNNQLIILYSLITGNPRFTSFDSYLKEDIKIYTDQIEIEKEIKDNNNIEFFNQSDCDYLIEHELLKKYNDFIQNLPERDKNNSIELEGSRQQFILINSISEENITDYDLFFSFFDYNFIKTLKDPQTVQFIGSENYMRQIEATKTIKKFDFNSEQLQLIKQMLKSRVNQMQVICNEFINQHKEQQKNEEEQNLENKHEQFINQYNIQYIDQDINIQNFHLDYRIYLLYDVEQIDFSFIGQQPLLNQYVNQFSEQQVNNLTHSDNFAFRQMILKPVQRTIFTALVYDMITYFYNQNDNKLQSKFVQIRKDMKSLENSLIKELVKTNRREKEKEIEKELEIVSKEEKELEILSKEEKEKALQNDKLILNNKQINNKQDLQDEIAGYQEWQKNTYNNENEQDNQTNKGSTQSHNKGNNKKNQNQNNKNFNDRNYSNNQFSEQYQDDNQNNQEKTDQGDNQKTKSQIKNEYSSQDRNKYNNFRNYRQSTQYDKRFRGKNDRNNPIEYNQLDNSYQNYNQNYKNTGYQQQNKKQYNDSKPKVEYQIKQSQTATGDQTSSDMNKQQNLFKTQLMGQKQKQPIQKDQESNQEKHINKKLKNY